MSNDKLFEAYLHGKITEEQYLRGELGIQVGDYVVKDDSWSDRYFGSGRRATLIAKVTEITTSRYNDQAMYHFDTGTRMDSNNDGTVRMRLATEEEIKGKRWGRG